VGSEMKQTSEIEEIRAALKRAAYKALHGTREERSGRFLPAKTARDTGPRRTPKRASTIRRKV
jgi:hypothetical protein